MEEKLIISLTSWKPRFQNLPFVLDSVRNQTVKPDLIVLNLADDEVVPDYLQHYIENHGIEINRMPDTKVFKKLFPTLRKYPEACVISIDDDFLLPQTMIADFKEIHSNYPSFPISGNGVIKYGMQCHCGAASLTKASFFGDYLDAVDDDLMNKCKSDDMVYTFLCNKAGNPYIRTMNRYFLNMTPIGSSESYSGSQKIADKCIDDTFSYLRKRFGPVDTRLSNYIADKYLCGIVRDVENKTPVSLRMLLKEKIFIKRK